MKGFTYWYKVLNIFLACVQNMTLGGMIFGWTSISGGMLIGSRKVGGAELSPDYVQTLFVVASFFSCLGPLSLGIILDTYGPRICSLCSIFIISIGFFMFGISDKDSGSYFLPALCLIAFGGPGAQSAIIHLSNLFPSWKATTTAIITGSFQLSFIIFLIFDQLWAFENVSYHSLFLGYLVVCFLNALISLFFWPDAPYTFDEQVHIIEEEQGIDEEIQIPIGHIRLPSVFIHHSDLKKMAGDAQEPIEEKKRLLIHDTTYETRSTKYFAELKDATLLDQVKSPEFLRLLTFFLVNSFCVNFYIGSFNLQLGDGISFRTPLERQDFARLFTLIITLGVIFIPIVGTIMDKYGFPMASSCTTIFGILWIIFLLVRTKASLLVSFCCYALFRTFFFTFVFAYLADTLGFKYFGVLAGIMFVLGGFLSFLQVPLAKLVSGDCHLLLSGPRSMPYCQPGHWQSLNILFGLMIAGTLYFSYKDWINREEQKAFRQQQQSSPSKQPGQPSSSSLQMVNQKKNPLHQQQTPFSNLKNYGAIHEDREEEEQ